MWCTSDDIGHMSMFIAWLSRSKNNSKIETDPQPIGLQPLLGFPQQQAINFPPFKNDTHTNNASTTPAPCVIRPFKCQGIGHLARECPNKQLVKLVEDPTLIYDTDNEEEIVENDSEVVYVDHGEALVI